MDQNLDLFKVFSQRVFRIPDYQRGYSWEDKELSELWDDLDEILDNDTDGKLKQHYTGTLFLKETDPLPEENWLTSDFYDIVDGQQRLTTIIILIFELLKVAESGYCEKRIEELKNIFIAKKNLSETNEVYKFGYYDSNQNNKFLQKIIFENDKIVLNDIKNHYTKNLKHAKDYFQKKISGLNDAQRDLLFRKVTSSLRFDLRIIEKDLDVQVVFETMNNRGKQLTILEKLKNRLIYITDKLIVPEPEKGILRKKINEAWGKIYDSLAQDPKEKPLDEDIFLSAHLSLYEEPEQVIFSERETEEKLFKMFCNKPKKHGEKPITYETIEKYIVSLSDLAPIWYEIHHPADIIIEKILLLNSSKEVKILLAALLIKNPDRKELHSIFYKLEQVFFMDNVPGIHLLNIEYESATKAHEIYINNELEEFADFLVKKIETQLNPESIADGFRYLFTYVRGHIGFHRWPALKYFLFAYEERLQMEFNETNKKISIKNFHETQIEHIFPNTWQNHWITEMNEFLETIDEEKQEYAIKVLLNSLGNLTILDIKNQRLKDDPWSKKKECFRTGSYNEIEISDYEQWNFKSIQKRGEKMLRFLCEKIREGFSLDIDISREILFDSYYIIKRIYGR